MAQEGTGGEPLLSPEQREWLGLGPDDSVRLLAAAGRRTIVLERFNGDSAALPWDRDLVLVADVRAFPIADVLHLIHSSGQSGFLFFENASHEKTVYLHRGEVVFAGSNPVVDRLGECLLRNGVITLEQHREAKCAYSPPGHFGKILVERGFLTPREVWNGVKAQVEDQVPNVAPTDRVESRHRLVEDHELGVVLDGLGQSGTLSHSLRELLHSYVCPLGDTELFQQRHTARLDRCR